ncbi:ribonuclease H-like domain-containing protein [Brevibacillus daliensis]|uniref:ribonuclease H-like domain-containing protein n=1 Tax=Brevibacillus daliensis TaxID=2892995 RepID=UPI001E511519|nr:ribonuclease H-like domain-containing protein [Brevibacillus daliensis]
MSLKNKLNRMKKQLTHVAPERETTPVVEVTEEKVSTQKVLDDVVLNELPVEEDHKDHFYSKRDQEIPHYDKWDLLQASSFWTEHDYVMVREVKYPLDHLHGRYRFEELFTVMEEWEDAGLSHPLSSSGKQPGDLLFFDTETTGLNGGVGNTIFLLGYSKIEKNEVVVRQHFLPDPFSEIALYQSFLDDVRTSKDLVTYNGKAFDWPQVKTRHTLVRDDVPELPLFGHIDLLHGARRLWKNELVSCRLSIVEQEKLHIIREHDVPGSLAPMLYFDYLREKDPTEIAGVLVHNEIDVLSLITLYTHMSKLVLAGERNHFSSLDEIFEVARWYEALGAYEEAKKHYKVVAKSTHLLHNKAKAALGHLFKREKDWDRALYCFEAVIRDKSSSNEEVCVEAAKICEHQLKDLNKALVYTQMAFERWQKKGSLLRQKQKVERDAYEKRIQRLKQKMGK